MLGPHFWKKYFVVYDALNSSPVYSDLLDDLVAAGEPLAGKYVLDAGAGTGNLALLLKSRGARVLAADFSPEALEIYKQKDAFAETMVVDLTKPLPFGDEMFDEVFTNNVVYNIPRQNRPALMAEFRRVLKPEGRIVISNVHASYKPIIIYWESLRLGLRREGFVGTLKKVSSLLIPTIKLFYYNWVIQHQHKVKTQNLMTREEQVQILKDAGFKDISPTESVYAGQADMNSALK